jgi:hypothetical protein
VDGACGLSLYGILASLYQVQVYAVTDHVVFYLNDNVLLLYTKIPRNSLREESMQVLVVCILPNNYPSTT